MTPAAAADVPGFPVKVLSVFAIKMFVFDINNDNLCLSPEPKQTGPWNHKSKGNNWVRTRGL